MTEIMIEIQPYIISILVILLGFVGDRLRVFLNKKIDKENQDTIKLVVEEAVRFVEQVSKVDLTLKGKAKFELAKEKVILVLNDKGLIITETELDMLIESFVLSLTLEIEDTPKVEV